MTTPILVAILATVGGVIVVGVGGGLIKPMQHRWEGYLQTAEREGQNIKSQASSNAPTGDATVRSTTPTSTSATSATTPTTTAQGTPLPPPRTDGGSGL